MRSRNVVTEWSNSVSNNTYGKVPQLDGDDLTPHHMPSNQYMKTKFDVEMRESYAMNLEQPFPGVGGRHRRTFTYGLSANTRPRDYELYDALKPRDAMAFDIRTQSVF